MGGFAFGTQNEHLNPNETEQQKKDRQSNDSKDQLKYLAGGIVAVTTIAVCPPLLLTVGVPALLVWLGIRKKK